MGNGPIHLLLKALVAVVRVSLLLFGAAQLDFQRTSGLGKFLTHLEPQKPLGFHISANAHTSSRPGKPSR